MSELLQAVAGLLTFVAMVYFIYATIAWALSGVPLP